MSCECHYYAFIVIDLGSNPTKENKPFQVKQVEIALDHYYETLML
jgi:hypothetical protein